MSVTAKPWEERFWPKVNKQADGCWIWTACRQHNGYGVFQDNGYWMAHRFIWEQLKGKIPKGMVLGHTCNVPCCVNLAHLELVTPLYNMQYKVASGRHRWANALPNPWVRPMRRTLFDRFWTKVNKTDDCWLWTAGLNHDGYGTFSFYGSIISVHRIAWMLLKSEIPKGMNVLHKCDVRNCLNPDHLYLGTQKENRRDADERGRTNLPKGIEHPRAILTEQNVREIRARYKCRKVTFKMLAKEFGVSWYAIFDIIKGKNWKHLI
jgi:HNH endonuclease